MNIKSSSKISDDAPVVTQADINRARFRVNLQDAPRKQRVNIMLDTGVIAFFKTKAGERGYQTLINETLKRSIHQEEIETLLRRIVREELASYQ
ncbi:MAG: BrnA antitoxin family protein [Deltaproteobacteria bacterium]|nr:BrnA antitoxin family protein [Deltaproteobacteria bacterium]